MRFWLFIVLVIGLLCPAVAHAQTSGVREFAPRFTANARGDIVFLANTLMQGEESTGADNNGEEMAYINVVSSLDWINSSTAELNLPSGSTVLWAGLYWGGNLLKPNGKSYKSPKNVSPTAVKLRTPSNTVHTLNATVSNSYTFPSGANEVVNGIPYSSFVDVTGIVQSSAGGNGTYTVGNVAAATGENRYAGWTIAVVYSDPAITEAKNLTVFDGFKIVSKDISGFNTVDIPITGFTAPNDGDVNVTLGVMAYEGDSGITGDSLSFGPTTASLALVSDGKNTSNNFANGTISYKGVNASSGHPAYPVNPGSSRTNRQGIDADIFQLPTTGSGSIPNSGTTAFVQFTSTSDSYYPAVVTTAIDLYKPQVTAVKTATKLVDDGRENEVTPGDILTYKIEFTNRIDVVGDDTDHTILTDELPSEVTYVPGSLKVVRVNQTGTETLTDAADSDEGKVVTTGGATTITVGLGHPSNDHNSPNTPGQGGGVVKRGEKTTVTFDVKVNLGVPHGEEIINEAEINYSAVATGVASASSSLPFTVNNSKVISGVVFEDTFYGGGEGRGPWAAGPLGTLAPGMQVVSGARVELYGPKAGGGTEFIAFDITDSDGAYSFTDVNNTSGVNVAKDYIVRVVSSSVKSKRGTAATVPVLTYKTKTTSEIINPADGEVSTVVPVLNYVGGETPEAVDAVNGTTGAALPAGSQNIALIRVAGADLLKVDFGFNFNTVVNKNDSGQGSLRQVITNTNTFGVTTVSQEGFVANTENVIFMIPNGTNGAGLRGLDYFTAGSTRYAEIAPTSVLPTISRPLRIDGSKQPGYVAGAGAIPVIYVNGEGVTSGSPNGFNISATGLGSIVRALSIGGFDGAGVSIVGGSANVIKGNLIGQDPTGAAAANGGAGIKISSFSIGNFIGGAATGEGNIIVNNTGSGLSIAGGSGNQIKGNLIGQGSTGAAAGNGGAGITINTISTSNVIGGAATGEGNVIVNNTGNGVAIEGGSFHAIKGNRIGLDASGAAGGNKAGGILIKDSGSNDIGGTLAGEGNIIAYNGTEGGPTTGGVFIDSASAGAAIDNGIRRNSIYQNKGLGIDLSPRGVVGNSTDGVLNNNFANRHLNYPVITSASLVGNILTVSGSAPAGTVVEFFKAHDDEDQDGPSVVGGTPDNLPHGEGELYLGSYNVPNSPANGVFTDIQITVSATAVHKITATASWSPGSHAGIHFSTSEFSPNVATADLATITGTVFDDTGYSGGAGRSKADAGSAGVGVQGATVELYKIDGATNPLVASTTTDSAGFYSFSDQVAATEYKVRVVNSTVRSSRAPSVSGLLPVQTFRTDVTFTSPSTVTVAPVTDFVGGTNPAIDDTAVGVLATSPTATPQSVATVAAGAVINDTIVSGVDFGFNFNTVVNTRNEGQGSLRQFIFNANALSGPDTAYFMLCNGTTSPGLRSAVALNQFVGGIASIAPATLLPAITEQVTISGANQPGYGVGSVIEVSGSAGATTGFTLSGGSGSAIDSLVINRFSAAAISITGPGSNVITANRIGTDAAGTGAFGNGVGVLITGSPNNTIGGTLNGAGNTISGNTSHGIHITGAGATGNKITGNVIGLASGGTVLLPNSGSGVLIEGGASKTVVGVDGAGAGAANKIAYNLAGGVVVTGTTLDNTIRQNSIWANTGLGIDLGATGVTPNSGSTSSTSPNNAMNYPVFTVSINGSSLHVTGFVGSAAGQTAFANAKIDFYKANNSPNDQNGAIITGDNLNAAHGEGQTYLGTVTADSDGNFDDSISVSGFGTGDTLTATATDSTGSTSEFSANMLPAASVSGVVYVDSNRSGTKDSGEEGTGLPLYAKLLAGNGTSGPPTSIVLVDPVTGAYQFPSVVAGEWTVVINGDNTPTNITPAYPAGWIGTEPSTGLRHLTVETASLGGIKFGVSPSVELKGMVFADIGNGVDGVANDGLLNGAEAGLANAKVELIGLDGTIHQTVTTGPDGAFSFLLGIEFAENTVLKIVKTNPANWLSTGASVGTIGNTSGTYDRATDTITFTYHQETDYTGIAFGAVPLPKFETEGQQTGLPGTIVFFPHIFTAGSSGEVTFSTVGEASPALPGWVETIYLDANGDGTFNTGDTVLNGQAVSLTAGQVVRILIKEFIPIAAPYDVRNKITVTASFTYTGSPASLPALTSVLTRSDLAIAGDPSGSGLVLVKKVNTETALPGEILTYTIAYSNNSTEPLSNITIYDATPEFTTFESAGWSTPLPDSVTAITLVAPVAEPGVEPTGALKWTFTGTLNPGATGTVTFQVKVTP